MRITVIIIQAPEHNKSILGHHGQDSTILKTHMVLDGEVMR